MSEPQVTLVTPQSLLVAPLIKGEVKPEGVPLRVEVAKNIDESSRRIAKLDYDFIETDIATFVRAKEERLPVRALPVFTSRRFLQRGIMWSQKAQIRDLHDLPSRAAVTPQYWLPSSIWQRKLLGMAYRVEQEQLSWVTILPERLENLHVPSGILHRLDTSGRTIEELARTGSTDIVLLPDAVGPAFEMRRMGATPPAFVPAFPDAEGAQKEFFKNYGIFPILTVVVTKDTLLEERPEVIQSVMRAYLESKRVAQSREVIGNDPQPALGATTKWMKDLMGEDPYSYGLEPNRKTLDSFFAACRLQMLLIHRFELEELFAPDL
jgi:4,5-dihydroxyphthalate decarboxylase